MSLIQRVMPSPLLSLGLLLLWLMLSRSVSAGFLLMGTILAVVVPLLTASLRPTRTRVRRPFVALRYVATVVFDMMVANVQVAYRVVLWRWRPTDARFVVIPLELRDPHGLAALAMVTTIVPGTVWSEIALDRTVLMLHVWNVGNEEQFIAHYKTRYEKPLREIFE